MKNCPLCNGKVEYKSEKIKYRYKNHFADIEQFGEYCSNCGEGFLSDKDLKSTKMDIANFKRGVEHLLTTNELKRIRKKLNLTQQDAGRLFGGGIRAFYKYETAETTQSKPLDILLRLTDLEKITIDDVKRVTEAR